MAGRTCGVEECRVPGAIRPDCPASCPALAGRRLSRRLDRSAPARAARLAGSWVMPRISADVSEMARRGAVLYAAAAALLLGSIPFPHRGADVRTVLVAAATAALGAAGLHRWGRHLPAAGFSLLTAMSTVLVSVLVDLGGSDASAYRLLYVWGGLYSFAFFGRRHALLQCALIALCAIVGAPSPFGPYRLMAIGTVVVAGLWMDEVVTRIRSLARVDSLTGIPNRRAWDEELPRRLAAADRSGRPVHIAILDLDNFKRLNDEHGHPAGDEVLGASVRAWGGGLRPGDFLARYGGEEFALILPECDDDDALAIVERVRVLCPDGLTCSAGLTRWDGVESAADLVVRADASLYCAKRQGRDRTVVLRPPGVTLGSLRLHGESSPRRGQVRGSSAAG